MISLLIDILIVIALGVIISMVLDKIGAGGWRNIIMAICALIIVVMLLRALVVPGTPLLW